MAGEWYDCHDKIFIERKAIASDWCKRYNATPYGKRGERYALLKERFGHVGANVSVGDNVLIAPGVQINTSTHPVELADRLNPDWQPGSSVYFCRTYALPVTIEDGCWIGAGVLVLPGVTIGRGSVIGAGSIVTKDIPANSVAVGNPCRVIRQINRM